MNLDIHVVKSIMDPKSGAWVCSRLLSLLHLWMWMTFIRVQCYCIRSERSPDITWLIGAPQWIASGLLAGSWMHYWFADRKPHSDNKGRNDSAITGKPPLISHLWVHLLPCQLSCLHMRGKFLIVLYFVLLFFLFSVKYHISHRHYQNQTKMTARGTVSKKYLLLDVSANEYMKTKCCIMNVRATSKISLRKSKGLGYCFTELWQTIAVSRVTLLQPFNSEIPNPALDK